MLAYMLTAETIEDAEAFLAERGWLLLVVDDPQVEGGRVVMVPRLVAAAGVNLDPEPWRSDEWAVGLPVRPAAVRDEKTGQMVAQALAPGFHVNVQLFGAAAEAETKNRAQVSEAGSEKMLRERTKLGADMLKDGQRITAANGRTTGTKLGNVTLTDPETVRTPYREWG